MNGLKRNYSIIVVTYNNADGLRRTLKSIRQLDYEQKEAIVVDGGSQDESQDIMAANQDVISFSVSEKDNGIYNAMNKGIGHAKGDFVRKLKDTMTLYDLLSLGICHQAVYYRREVLQKYGFDESYKLIADLKSVVEPYVKDHITLTCITQPLAVCESGGVSKVRWRETLIENRRMIDELVDPFYKADYLRFSRVNNGLLHDFVVLSHFKSIFPLIKWLSKMMSFLNCKFKHIPIE